MSLANPAPVLLQGPPNAHGTNTPEHPFVEATIPQNQQIFPVRTFKIFGGVQIGIGVLLGILSVIGIIFDSMAMHKYVGCASQYYDPYSYDYNWSCYRRSQSHVVFAFDVTCLLCAGWKIAFMICCILGASVFAPTMFGLGVTGAVLRGNYDSRVIVLSAFISILSLTELIMATIGAAYCCCCSPLGSVDNPVNVVYLNASQPGVVMNLPQTQMPMIATQYAMAPSVQYPRAQQYQVINPTPTEFINSNSSTEPPAYKE